MEVVQTRQADPFSCDPDHFAVEDSKPAVPVGKGRKKTTTRILGVEVFRLPVAEEVTTEERMWDLSFTLTEVSHLKDDSWVEGIVTMPIFKVNSVKGGSRVKEGSWDLWSCQAETGEDGKPDLSNLRAVLVQLKQVKR